MIWRLYRAPGMTPGCNCKVPRLSSSGRVRPTAELNAKSGGLFASGSCRVKVRVGVMSVRLPSVRGRAMQVAQSSEEVSLRPVTNMERSEISILVVDDSADDYKAISRLLSRLDGYAVTATRASSGLAARSGISTSRYDVVIADYRLGPETGVDVIKSILRQRPAIAPILISGDLSPEVQKAALNAGAIYCIDKDWLSTKTLECAIRTAMNAVFSRTGATATKPQLSPAWLH